MISLVLARTLSYPSPLDKNLFYNLPLQDTEEAEYWKKIAKDMEDKKTGKVVVPKIKKKKRLLDKLEKSTHIHFD